MLSVFSAVRSLSPPRRRSAASRRAAPSAGPTPCSSSTAPGCRRPGIALLFARLQRHQAGSRQRQPGQGDGQDRPRLPARRTRRPRPHRQRHLASCAPSRSAPCPSWTRRSRTATSPLRKRSRSTSPSTASSITRTSITSPSSARRASGSRRRSRACASAARSSTPTSPSSTASASSWPPATTRRCSARTPPCSIVVPADGTYVIQVRESAYGGNGGCQYRLHVGTFPRPTGGRAGRRQARRGSRSDLPRRPGRAVQAEDQAARDGRTRSSACSPRTPAASAPSPVPFRLSEFGNVVETERNNTHADRPRRSELPLALNGVIAKPGEVDYFRFTAKKGQTFDVHCYARRLGSPLDSVMTLGVRRRRRARRQRRRRRPGQLFPLHRPGRQGIRPQRHRPSRARAGRRTSTASSSRRSQPKAVVSIPKVAQYSQERQTIAVPRGNRMATLVNVARGDFGGELVDGRRRPAGRRDAATPRTWPPTWIRFRWCSRRRRRRPVGGKLATLTAQPRRSQAQKIQSRF